MIKLERGHSFRRTIIVLVIIFCVLLTIISWGLLRLYNGYTAQFGPTEGVWYCEGLSLQVSFEYGAEAHLFSDGEDILCTIISRRQSPRLKVFEAESIVQTSEGPAINRGELLYDFRYISFDNECFVVSDETGNEYLFTRLD